MERIANRLARLEARLPPPPRARIGSVTLAELRSLEACIKRLEAGEVGAAPVIKSAAPDAETAAVVRELERLELLDHAPEGRPRWT